MGRRFRGWGGGSLSQLQGAREKTGTDGEKGHICGVNMKATGTELHPDTEARENLKCQIQGLSDESMKKLWEAIQGGAFGAPK